MAHRFFQLQSPNPQIFPGTELALISARHARALQQGASNDLHAPHLTPGLAGILQALGPCPSPATLRAGLTQADETHYWVALEPSYWRIEPGGLRWMAHGDALALDEAQSEQLFNALEPIFADSPANLQRGAHGELSLLCANSLAPPQAWYPDQLLGAEMKSHLPSLTLWQRWLNEVQMQLNGSQLNLDRAQNAQAPINSVWFWGAEPVTGTGPTLALQYHGEDPILQARAKLSASGKPVQLYDWRDLDQASVLDKLVTLSPAALLLCSEGFLYQRHKATVLARWARWLGLKR